MEAADSPNPGSGTRKRKSSAPIRCDPREFNNGRTSDSEPESSEAGTDSTEPHPIHNHSSETSTLEANFPSTSPTPAQRSMLVCLVCGVVLQAASRRPGKTVVKKLEHILSAHLKKTIYSCPYCPNCSSIAWRGNVIVHMKKNHPEEPMVVRSQLETYREEIEAWRLACFGGVPDKRTMRKPKIAETEEAEVSTNHVPNNKERKLENFVEDFRQEDNISNASSTEQSGHSLSGSGSQTPERSQSSSAEMIYARKSRKSLSLDDKINLVRDFEVGNLTRNSLQEKYGIARVTVNSILKKSDDLLKNGGYLRQRKQRRMLTLEDKVRIIWDFESKKMYSKDQLCQRHQIARITLYQILKNAQSLWRSFMYGPGQTEREWSPEWLRVFDLDGEFHGRLKEWCDEQPQHVLRSGTEVFLWEKASNLAAELEIPVEHWPTKRWLRNWCKIMGLPVGEIRTEQERMAEKFSGESSNNLRKLEGFPENSEHKPVDFRSKLDEFEACINSMAGVSGASNGSPTQVNSEMSCYPSAESVISALLGNSASSTSNSTEEFILKPEEKTLAVTEALNIVESRVPEVIRAGSRFSDSSVGNTNSFDPAGALKGIDNKLCHANASDPENSLCS